MGKSFVYKWPVTKLSDQSKAFAKTIVENFKDLQVHLNEYGVSRDADGTTVTLTDLNLTGGLFVTEGVSHSAGPELAEIYAGAAQALTGGSWEQLKLDTINGTSGPLLTENVGTYDISTAAAGIFLAVAQVEFAAQESGYIRITVDDVERARAAFTTRTGGQVIFIGRAVAADRFEAEVFSDAGANVNVGSNATFLRVTRLFSLA